MVLKTVSTNTPHSKYRRQGTPLLKPFDQHFINTQWFINTLGVNAGVECWSGVGVECWLGVKKGIIFRVLQICVSEVEIKWYYTRTIMMCPDQPTSSW